MKKIATITFHRAQNHGSALQTFALQKFIMNLGKESNEDVSYKVIDLNSQSQKNLYKLYKKREGLKGLIKNAIAFVFSKSLKERAVKFQSFLDNEICLTKRYENSDQVCKQLTDIDYFICGSDQIWNVRAKDFSDFYFLNFNTTAKKISYAASFGPLAIDWDKYGKSKYKNFLEDFDAISVREDASARNIQQLTEKECMVHVDPTILLDVEDWRAIQSKANYKNGEYILLYCLEPSKKQLEMAKQISKKLKLPIIVLRYNNKNDMVNSFVKKYDAGPKDFLAYIDNAKLVLTSSFHGTVFSLIYKKSFYVFDGMKDNRISSILVKADLCEQSITSIDEIDRIDLKPLDESKINDFICSERARSKAYLTRVLGI